MMRVSRRQFLQDAGMAGLGLLGGCGRLPGQTQAPKIYRIGFLTPGAADQPGAAPQYAALWAGLRDLGYSEGANIVVEYRYADGHEEHLPTLAAELVQLHVTSSWPPARSLRALRRKPRAGSPSCSPRATGR